MARKLAGLQANLWDATRVRLRPRRSAGPRAPAVGSIGRTATLHRDAFTSASHPSRGAVWSTAPSGEASVCRVCRAPLGLFCLRLTLTNLTGGLIAALAWALTALGRRVVTRTPIPAVLWLPTGLLVVRTAIGYATG